MLFNSQNAREFAARSAEGRRQAKLIRLERDRMLDRLIQEANDRTVQPAAQAETETECPDDGYVNRRLQRVRTQIEKLDAMLEGAADATTIDRVASAIARLSELERLYAGRPLPGSRRPSADRSKPLYVFSPPLDS